MYNRLSDYYDEIFTFEESIANKLKREFPDPDKGTLLDLACGTGTYTIHMARKGYTLLGTDLDREMIEKAVRKTSEEKDSVQKRLAFLTEDMRKLSTILSQNPFTAPLQGVYCLGNSLPHLSSWEEIYAFFGDVKKILERHTNKEGKLLVQTVNFDRLPREGEFSLPSIRNEEAGLLFTRSYRIKKGEKKVTFVTELTSLREKENISDTNQADGASLEKKSKNSIKGEVDLIRAESEILLTAAKKAGFSDIHTFGSYEDAEFHPDKSFLFLLSAGIS